MNYSKLSRKELIAEIKKLESENEELKKTKKRMELALKHGKLIIAKCDRDLRYNWIYNPHCDFNQKDKIGKRDNELNQGPGIKSLMKLKKEVIETGQEISKEISFELSTGEVIYDVIAKPIIDQEEVTGVVTASLNITRLKKVYQQLMQSTKNEVIAQLAIGISHQVNNILAVIMGDVELVLFDDKSGKSNLSTKSKTMLNNIKEQCGKAKRMIFDLKSISEPGITKQEECSIVDLMEEALSKQEYLLKTEQIQLEKSYDKVSKVNGDPKKLTRVFSNLIVNACHAVQAKGQGKIVIKIEKQQKKVKVEIKDTGIGINKQVQHKIFLPLFTTKGEWGKDQTDIKGIGLGLTAAERIIQEHQGQIKVKSQVGIGSTFIVELPIT